MLVWDAVEQVVPVVPCLDLGGSMIESIEEFYRSFGAVPVPCLRLRRSSLRLQLLRGAMSPFHGFALERP